MRRKPELIALADRLETVERPQPEVNGWTRALRDLQEIIRENVHGASIDWDEYEQMWTITVKQAGHVSHGQRQSFHVETWDRFAADTSPMDLVAAAINLYDELTTMSTKMSRALND
jgi:hypothetical protein